jgi:hypothetical protein
MESRGRQAASLAFHHGDEGRFEMATEPICIE